MDLNLLIVERADLAGSRAEIRIATRDARDTRPFGYQDPRKRLPTTVVNGKSEMLNF
jgi:hypothetical protein